MGPYGSVGAHIKTGRSSMAQDHFKTPPDPKMAHKNIKMTQTSWLGSRWDCFYSTALRPLLLSTLGGDVCNCVSCN